MTVDTSGHLSLRDVVVRKELCSDLASVGRQERGREDVAI